MFQIEMRVDGRWIALGGSYTYWEADRKVLEFVACAAKKRQREYRIVPVGGAVVVRSNPSAPKSVSRIKSFKEGGNHAAQEQGGGRNLSSGGRHVVRR